jgi:hypothetical protein
MKECRRCKQNKHESSFRRASWGGLQSWCKLCESEYQKELYVANPAKHRQRRANYVAKYRDKYNASRRANRSEIYISECSRKYKASKEVIRELLSKGKCEICGSVHRLSIDHCHARNQIRGLLCDNCNNLLGRSKDSISILKHAIKYLRRCTTF